MVKWALKHEGEATFDPERILPACAEEAREGQLEDRGLPGRVVRAMPRDRTGTRPLQERRGVGRGARGCGVSPLQGLLYCPQSLETAF